MAQPHAPQPAPFPPLVNFTAPSEWRWQAAASPGWWALFHQGRQVGAWHEAGDYYELQSGLKWGPALDSPPVATPVPKRVKVIGGGEKKPESPKKVGQQQQPEAEPNYGVDKSKLYQQPKYLLNGREVSRESAVNAITKDGKLVDDSKLPRLTVIGPKELRAKVVADLKSHPALADLAGKVLVKEYAPDHWHVKGVGFKTDGKPTIYYQAPSGRVLHRQDDYEGGPELLATALRKADPAYDAAKDADRRKSLPVVGDLPPAAWLLGGAALLLLVAGKKKD